MTLVEVAYQLPTISASAALLVGVAADYEDGANETIPPSDHVSSYSRRIPYT